MDVNSYRQRLIELEAMLPNHVRRDVASSREQLIDTESEDFTEAELNASTLQQVQAALRRIENGTYGQCPVDGGPIESKRLDAVPWAPYCIRHQKLLEAASKSKATL
jgi:DnaK suppressor protein